MGIILSVAITSLYDTNNHTTTITFHISHGCKIPYRGGGSPLVWYIAILLLGSWLGVVVRGL